MKVKQRKSHRLRSVTKAAGKDVKPVSDIFPYKGIQDNGFALTADGEYQAFLRVRTTDLNGLDATTLNLYIERFIFVLRVYEKPFKILSGSNNTNTSEQQSFWKSKVNEYRKALASTSLSEDERTSLNYKLQLATDEVRRHAWVEAELEEQAFFFVLYDSTERALMTDIKEIVRLGDRALGLEHICDKEEIEKLIFKLNNMNS